MLKLVVYKNRFNYGCRGLKNNKFEIQSKMRIMLQVISKMFVKHDDN